MSESRGSLGKRILRTAGKTIGVIALVVLALVASLYIPAVQDLLVPKVLELVNSSDGMEVEVGHFRLKFPLNVEIRDLSVKQRGDTMLMARSVDVDVAVGPLFSGNVEISRASLAEVYFKSGAPDSTMYLRARLDKAGIKGAGLNLSEQDVDLKKLVLDGGRVDLAVGTDTTPPTPPSPVDWKIHAGLLSLRNVDVRMSMVSTGDSLSVALGSLDVAKGDVDLLSHNMAIDRVEINRVDAKFLSPREATAQPERVEYPSPDTVPWTIALRHLSVDSSAAVYGRRGAVAQPGFDMDMISVSRLRIAVDSFYNRGQVMRVPVREISGLERSGVSLDLSGLLAMTPEKITAKDMILRTTASAIEMNAVYGLDSETPSAAPVRLDLDAEVSVGDLQKLFPGMREAFAQLPQNRRINLRADVDGTMADLDVERIKAEIPGHLTMAMNGRVANVTDFANVDGRLNISGNLRDTDFIKSALVDRKSRSSVAIPSMTLDGDVEMKKGSVSGRLKAVTSAGKLALDAFWNGTREAYDIDLNTTEFPINSFLPQAGVGRVTANVKAKGRRLDPFNARTELTARVDAVKVEYNGRNIHDIILDASLAGGQADVSLQSRNPAANLTVDAAGNLSGATYDWTLRADVGNLDLHAIGMSDSVFDLSTAFTGKASITPKQNRVAAALDFSSFDLTTGGGHFIGRDIDVALNANDSLTKATVTNQDLDLCFESPTMLDSVMARFSAAGDLLGRQIEQRMVDVTALQQRFPPFSLRVDAAGNNMLSRYLASTGTTFSSAHIVATNDSLINISATVDTLASGDTRLDHIVFEATQRGKYLRYKAVVDNEPGTMDKFAYVQLNGYLADDKISAFLKQQDVDGKTGYSIGGVVAMTDSTLSLKFIPFKPVIGYKEWTVNTDNFIMVNTRRRHIDANLLMENAESSLQLYTEHDTVRHLSGQEDIIARISNIKIADWIAVNPYAPPMKGDLSADMRFALDSTSINGSGNVMLKDFIYGKKRVGTLDAGLDLTTGKNGFIYAVTSLKVDGDSVMRASGVLNDTTAVNPFMLDMDLTRFPLSMANPFLDPQTASFGGYITGKMDVTGSVSAPRFDGYLMFDSATAKVGMIGTTFRFAEDKIAVDSNIIRFAGYPVYGINDKPLTIDGTVDMRDLSGIGVDLRLKARDWQVVGTDKKKGCDVYGKAFLNVDATVRGPLNFLTADAQVTVLPQTNVTYIIPDATSKLTSRSNSEMVKFVNFNDTTQAVAQDSVVAPPGMSLDLTALLTVAQGSTVSVDLSTDGKNKVQLKSQGTLDYSMNHMGDSRFTGRLNIDGGFVRYTPPLMSEKLFNFQEGSYVGFNGDMMNPVLNIHAIDEIKANVTQEGQNSRLIDFDVALNVSGTLSEMNVAFDLSTDDDVTVQNELQSMSAEQRANQAMNLLLYNVYTGPGTKGNASLSGNPLYSFLESKLNSWMANNVKGVDISFGIDRYDRTIDGSSSMTTSYSYKVSKTFLDDRFKIVVGGNYSTDANADENLSQNLINDISFEYMLNRSGSMYVRLFRHTGYESILEGEVTQTGVGFVYKRKLRTLRDLFRFGRRPKNGPAPEGDRPEPMSAEPNAAAKYETEE